MTIAFHHRPKLRTEISNLIDQLRKDATERGQVDEVVAYARAIDAIHQAGNYDAGKP